MDEKTKKSVQQSIILVVLILVLGGLAFKMFSGLKPKPQGATKAKVTAKSNKPKTESGMAEGETPTATNMPVVPRTGDKAGTSLEISEADLHLNPNQFKVFALNPPKNPFVQSEQWYSDELNKIPGYPELKSNDYLNQTEAYLPNIPLVNSEQWESITVDRSVESIPFEISGLSDDGKITTTVRLKPKAAEGQHLSWSPATGVPVNELKNPGVVDRYRDVLTGPIPVAKKDEDGFVADALGVPGDGSSRSADGLLDSGEGDSLFAVGVSHHGKEATALIRHNGKTRIVREGSVLPTHYQVLTIKENGVVVVDLRDGSSKWLPLGAAPAEAMPKAAKKVKSA